MGRFFLGWKRKTGCVVLVLAIASAGLWCRSLTRSDFLTIVTSKNLFGLNLEDGTVELIRHRLASGEPPHNFVTARNSWVSFVIPQPDGSRELLEQHLDDIARSESKAEFCGFIFASGKYGHSETQIATSFFIFPYQNVVIPLSLLSACLLLSRPPKVKVKAVERQVGPSE